MPQFDLSVFVGQIFWLLVSFGTLYLGVYFIVFPLFNSIFNARKKLIDIPLEKADKIAMDTQGLELEMEKKKLDLQKRNEEKLNSTYQDEANRLQIVFNKVDKSFSESLKRLVQKINKDESVVLKNTDTFVQNVLKGSK